MAEDHKEMIADMAKAADGNQNVKSFLEGLRAGLNLSKTNKKK